MNSRLFLLLGCLALTACAGAPLANSIATRSPDGGIVTLYQHDPLASSLCFATGEYGHVIQDHIVKNQGSELSFGQYHAGEFSVAIQGGDTGAIVDLGTQDEVRARYGYEETVGGGQGFASIRLQDGKLVILADYKAQTTQPLLEAEALAGKLTIGAHEAVRDRHVYLVRLRRDDSAPDDRWIKLLVLDYRPDVSVTIRWQAISPSANS